MNVKFHLIQQATDQYTAENVSKITNQNVVVVLDLAEDHEMTEVLDMAEDQAMVEVQGLVEALDVTDQDKCILQPVQSVEMNVKYHSSQRTADQYTATNVFKIINKICKFFKVDHFNMVYHLLITSKITLNIILT
jgi:hypothetical protein